MFIYPATLFVRWHNFLKLYQHCFTYYYTFDHAFLLTYCHICFLTYFLIFLPYFFTFILPYAGLMRAKVLLSFSLVCVYTLLRNFVRKT